MASPPAACAAGATAAHARAATATAVNTIVGREVLRPAPAAALACDEVMPRPSPPPPLQPRPARWPVSRAERSHALPRRAIQAHHRRAIGLRHPPPPPKEFTVALRAVRARRAGRRHHPPPKEFTVRRGGRRIYKELSSGPPDCGAGGRRPGRMEGEGRGREGRRRAGRGRLPVVRNGGMPRGDTGDAGTTKRPRSHGVPIPSPSAGRAMADPALGPPGATAATGVPGGLAVARQAELEGSI